MNRDTAEGKFDQFKGKVKQSVGEAIGNTNSPTRAPPTR